MNNGRVSDINDGVNSSVLLDRVDRATPHQSVFDAEMTKGIRGTTEVGKLFFSSLNLDALQDGIRYSVFKKSCQKHTIGRQSDDELKVVMRSVFLQHSKNLSYDIVEQVRELNGRVLDYAVNTILKELDMYIGYRKDQASLPMPLDRGQNESVTGLKSNEFKTF
jgi:hypothetical protein